MTENEVDDRRGKPMNVRELIKQAEGFRSKPYRDTEGKLTIGYGTLIEDGISRFEADFLFENRFGPAKARALKFPWYDGLTPARQFVIVSMIYQMGITRFKKFKKTIGFIRKGDWDNAGDEMLDSLWHRQTPNRAMKYSRIMKRGTI